MFDGLKRLWGRIVSMFSYTTLKNIIGRDVALSQTMIDAINEWKRMLAGEADWCDDTVESLKLEEGICREFADCVLVEMDAQILNNDEMDTVLQKALSDINRELQNGLALGSMVLRPLGKDRIEYITTDKMIPISFDDDGKPNDIAFLSMKCVGENDYYTRVERHYFTNGNLTIENSCFHSQSKSDIGQRCELTEVSEWQQIQPGPIMYPGMTQMDFGYYQNPVKNKVDGSSCGVSIFESAKGRIRKADIQGARLDWEYDSGERAIHVDEKALKHKGGRTYLPRLKKRLYKGLNLEDGKDKELYKEYSPEVLTSKTRKYNRVSAIQEKLQTCLEDFVAALAFYSGTYMSRPEFACKFNDSILTDEESERKQDRQDVSMGAMSLVEYRMKWYNEDEATAKSKVVDETVPPNPQEE